jgi:hypothetical protein
MQAQYIKIDEDGSKFYFKDREMNILHREDGPAIEYAHGSKFWFINGRLHREDGPAIDQGERAKLWYIHGKRHRKGGPAVEYDHGLKEWHQHGQLHRVDGPAIEYGDGKQEWYFNGQSLTQVEHAKQTSQQVEHFYENL